MKRFVLLAVIMLLFLSFSMPCYAASYDEMLKDLYEQSGMEDAVDVLDEQTLSMLYGLGIDPKDALTLLSADLSSLPQEIWKLVKQNVNKPMGMLLALIAVLLLMVCLQGVIPSKLFGLPQDMILLIASVGILGEQVVHLLRQLSAVFLTLGNFMELFLPVYAGIMAASGQTAGAYGMQALTFGASGLITALMREVILPCLSVYLALCLLCAANDLFDVEAVTKALSGAAAWVLGASMSLFTIVLGVQRMIASAADTLGMKTAKFALSTLIPVVGSQLSDALASVTTCFQILSSSFGSFALLAVMMLFLPVTVSLVLMLLTVKLAQMAAALFRVEAAKRMYASLAGGFGMLLGVTLCAFCAVMIALALLWSTASAV